MSTLYSTIIDSFLIRVEKDMDFFKYFNLTDFEALVLAQKRARGYLEEAIGKLTLKCSPEVDFYDTDDDLEQFNFDLTGREKFLLVSLMYEMYLGRDIACLKTLNVNFTPSELKVFDPTGARNSFMDMYKFVCAQNEELIDDYKNQHRETGTYKSIDYGSYEDE